MHLPLGTQSLGPSNIASVLPDEPLCITRKRPSALSLCLQNHDGSHEIAAIYDLSTRAFEPFHITESPFCSGTGTEAPGPNTIEHHESSCLVICMAGARTTMNRPDHFVERARCAGQAVNFLDHVVCKRRLDDTEATCRSCCHEKWHGLVCWRG